MPTKVKKLFCVRKYVWAESASDALRLEKKIKPDDIWLDDDWKKAQSQSPVITGFKK